ncbi:DUF5700 domain-containing putative Zn-dependent protease [Marinifilum fragile]|uniref:DUF5700 domain-containing putative Zn-dependent protease n=1 Tax=Marinifilum fragile TaxID=570161 RepID=UPI002AAB5C78|nr:DUF5700 domain-containing putative Zn-dependent protease [Marinifilum fragile]
MRKVLILALLLTVCSNAFCDKNTIIQKGQLKYDFSFAKLAIQYLETGDTCILSKISRLEAVDHIMNHAKKFNYNVPKSSNRKLVEYLLHPLEKEKLNLDRFKRNLKIAKEQVLQDDFIHEQCKEFLPAEFQFTGSLFFTYGYDLGVVYGKNASINLAHSHYLNQPGEIRYYMLHELHHAGFFECSNKPMPHLDLKKYSDAVDLITLATQLEGVATYVPLKVRLKENAMNSDADYVCLNDSLVMQNLEKEYFQIYYHFFNQPGKDFKDSDWKLIACLSNGKRLWYRVGALMAKTIDEKLGRKELVNLINEDPKAFINCYLSLKNQ